MNTKADPGPDHAAADKAPDVAPIVAPEGPAPLTDAERARYVALSEPRMLSEAEEKDKDALAARAMIPSPPPVLDPVHQAMHDIVTMFETLARHVPTAHSLGASVSALRDKIDAAWLVKKK